MAVRSGFFNSVNGDRKYDAKRFAEYFSSFIGNGVFPNPSDGLQVAEQLTPDMTVTVKAGKAWINGYIMINDDDYILTIEPADGVLNRIDRIVARYDVVDREIRLEVKKGTFASSPVAPTLQRDSDAYELALADVYVGAGVVSIVANKITDLRSDTALCGKVDSLIAGDINSLVAAFNEHKAEIASDEDFGHVRFNDMHGLWKRIDVIILDVTVAQLDISVPQEFDDIKIIGSNIDSVNSLDCCFNNDIAENYVGGSADYASSSQAYSFYSTMTSMSILRKDWMGSIGLNIFETEFSCLNNDNNARMKNISTHRTRGDLRISSYVYKKTDAILNINIKGDIKAGSTFEIWGR
ncbi:hypothetical protein [Paratissierella segnis]|uniref:Uncharacterized protein n=1 Tax=Paratissierella segnis TaxID=2763679 RepID=A0A926ET64_9FIRM|nr:hypothetical protein [Paratissierella segnis]MBC8589323.1 hypothetical protein [Paratissierella segnis]